jgi:hypothetical protein
MEKYPLIRVSKNVTMIDVATFITLARFLLGSVFASIRSVTDEFAPMIPDNTSQ